MKKKLLFFMTVIFAFLSAPLMVSAETYSGGDGWKVEFDGTNLNSTFKSTDINDSIQKLQPGDTVNISLQLHNTYDALTDWYMTNEVLQSLEDSQSVANGGAYSYILTYVDPTGVSELIYSSETIGGDNSGVQDEGLHQATGTLEDFFYLGDLDIGETAQIKLTVALEGETQGNDYQDTLAKLQMNFAVEVLEDIEGITVDENGNRIRRRAVSSQGGSAAVIRAVKTGDDMVSIPFVVTTLLLGIGFVVLALVKNAKEKKMHLEVLLLGCILAFAYNQPVSAAPGGDAESYTYTVTVYSGKQSDFTGGSGIQVDNHKTGSSYKISGLGSGSDMVRITGLEYGDVVIMDAQSCVQIDDTSKYYVGGVRESGRDNNTVSESAFKVDSDRDYVVAYAIKGNMVSYTVNYVDEAGTPLLESQTYYGAVGDRPVVAYRYIENYIPLSYNMTQVLVEDASQNVFTFIYQYSVADNKPNVTVLEGETEVVEETEESTEDGSDTTILIEDDANGGNGDGEDDDEPLDLIDLDDEDVPLAYQIAQKIAEFVGENMVACISVSVIVIAGLCMLFLIMLKRKKRKQDDGENEETEEVAEAEKEE